ncbi:hypothetical protein ColTof4_06308 [Colletotrichum tofieldiae]|nr:hypothetical protein ColTof3_01493 [Colletotrichum tofieldiae]GKT73885.1 hypothetical protein ColTof4_06308 [Colletotrichum tofieldiae]GKT95856.1 hypothetical protein Ct61P_13706 [Colletotrichum tofieldiae]
MGQSGDPTPGEVLSVLEGCASPSKGGQSPVQAASSGRGRATVCRQPFARAFAVTVTVTVTITDTVTAAA